MDYKQKYEQALERAKVINPGTADYEVVVKIFPELAESEDEKIRKALVELVHDTTGDSLWADYNVHKEDALAWLEKQSEQKQTLPKWKYKKDNTPLLRDSIILNKYGCVAKSPSGALVSDVWVMDYDELAKLPKEEFEKQGEQIPADLPNGEDYGIDSLYHAARILEKTLGEVDGYQSDDGILEHKCAIEAVKRLYEHKTAWSEEDEEITKGLNNCIDELEETYGWRFIYDKDIELRKIRKWLKSLKERMKGE